jgi:hypothetical protein
MDNKTKKIFTIITLTFLGLVICGISIGGVTYLLFQRSVNSIQERNISPIGEQRNSQLKLAPNEEAKWDNSILAHKIKVFTAESKDLEMVNVKKSVNSPQKFCRYEIEYPQLKKDATPAYDLVNKEIEEFFIPNENDLKLCDSGFLRFEGEEYKGDLQSENTYDSTTTTYKVGVSNENFISIASYSLYNSILNGDVQGAHPYKETKTLNLSLTYGAREFPTEGMFSISDINFLQEQARKEMINGGSVFADEEVDGLTLHESFWYLDKSDLVLVNLSDIYALQSVEVRIPYSRIENP